MKENEAGYQAFSSYTMRSSNSPRLVFLFIGFFILVGAILVGLFALGSSQKKTAKILSSPIVAATATPLPTSSASATVTIGLTGTASPTNGLSTYDRATNLDRSKLVIAVLNGSGELGAAKQVSSYLESLGYGIAKVGNADVFTYRNLTIQVKKSKSSYASLLKKDLQANPALASVSASISDDISSDAEVIVGR
jgi:hypothetical protein